jgi:hypothetical protein
MGMGQLKMCRVCGREFESDEELNKHEPKYAFSRQNYYLQK